MKVHVVGAGLAGLGAATALAARGLTVELSEAAAQAGGRCRSYFDSQIGLVIDNGNHLVLSGNRAVRDYLALIGASDMLTGPAETRFPFVDLETGRAWTVRPNAGAVPWWILTPGRGVPGARFADFLGMAGLLRAKPGQRVDETIRCQGPVWDRLMRPFLLAALNAEPESASAELAAQVIRETLARGGAAYAPRVPTPGLAATFVNPALDYLEARGGALRLQRRLLKLRTRGERVTGLEFSDGPVEVGPRDRIVLAVPPWVAKELAPELTAPERFEGIVNGHFRVAIGPGPARIIGVLNGTVEWIFCFEDRISVTVSGANRLMNAEREDLARELWGDVSRALDLSPELPPWQVIKERRATFLATVDQQALRPAAQTPYSNLLLAGDWTATGLPATIEGALRSGARAAGLIQEAFA
ncbi:MAG TPA: hydroxysqualene dehydroxylase HpnE [Phenylobacterium sp.]|jgi:squalene-associated FAD-dependent desaturase|uniref:hydroxysqualene dehydroxylase HpnE n=1 Tax=Phenylobacterium sp. TaxID=1871053 RepID=UPI002BE1BA6A|nr:hydroxysqualene dehydroxylase HpnE [Phenylobacterium sp.]HXA40592.1 hydroxysqualene dehydroxylase HpnE [Phenylobacterium sp.]